MVSAVKVFAINDPEDLGHCLSLLPDRFHKAGMFLYCLDSAAREDTRKHLTKFAWHAANRDGWADDALKALDELVGVALFEASHRGVTVEIKADLLRTTRSTWYRKYSKPYGTLLEELDMWASVARLHVAKRANS